MSNKFQEILLKYRKFSISERDKGDKFERLMQAYLLTDPTYTNLFKKVWLWSEFPGRKDLGGSDTGIDLVALTTEGDYWAIQCKCYLEDSAVDKPAVDSFLSTSSRAFRGENLETTKFAHRLWISTTNKWGTNAEQAIKNQNPPVSRLNIYDLQEAPVDWEKLEEGLHGEASRMAKKSLRPHQRDAVEKTHESFKTADRGKLIMACGTGKTYVSLKIAENETANTGFILFLVPSIALMSQVLREWSADADEPLNPICICSDPKVSKKSTKDEDKDYMSVVDLALPASTSVSGILKQFRYLQTNRKPGMTVVFSTYQSINVISQVQKELAKENNIFGEFDLIICDEAHRTTGVTLAEEDSSAFVKVHDNEFIKAKKRLYMTATPRLYSDDAKSRAAQADAVLCSMDDVKLYGEEMYRIGFGQSVDQGLLSDYKVLILTLSDKDVPPAVQRMVAGNESEIGSDDASKLIGCVNALSKQILGDGGSLETSDPEPMRKAVAFCQNIATSKKITNSFNDVTSSYIDSLPAAKREEMVSVNSRHIDGTMAAPEREELMSWLKEETDNNECRVLTNVRCLSEGVDVPSLDAVMFLSARNSQVDVVQSVGRVMRKSPGKKYGYIIIPVVVPSDVEANKALDDNERYKVVWTVLNALRAHDDRFNATVNKIELNKKKPDQILVGRPEYTFEDGAPVEATSDVDSSQVNKQLAMKFEQLQNVVFARMVKKVGERTYWEQWAKNVAEIAERESTRIHELVRGDMVHKQAFADFVEGLRKNINPSITENEAIEMLAQHIITKPVFEALFEGYSFVKNNAISISMQKMLDLLEEQAIEKDTETLQKFYESVKMRASGIDNSEGKQRIIVELYDKFFKAAFPKTVERLGIVYTPIEIVDFIIHSVDDVLKKEFGRSIGDDNVHILDPFTGTGTFITRLLQSGLISKENLANKYQNELHANEIVLLAYYIAAVNIENAFHELSGETEYKEFSGICLTDTFQLGETDESERLFSEMFSSNSERVINQKKAPIRVIMGNPPYSVGQRSANDNAQNQKYERLDSRIADTYAALTNATNKNSLYDSYIRAFRWSSDRLDSNGGIICFVSNGAWIDGNSADGFRKSLEKEFSSIYVFNLRGNQRTSGELSRKEGGKIFGSGSRTPISITLLVKKPSLGTQKASIYYNDIGEYLSREEKLAIVKQFQSVNNSQVPWKKLQPNEHGDWISMRNDVFDTYFSLGSKETKGSESVFNSVYSRGLVTARDAWCYNYSFESVEKNMHRTIDYYNQQRAAFFEAKKRNYDLKVENFVNYDSTFISWNRGIKQDLERNKSIEYSDKNIFVSSYRPFNKMKLYFAREMNDMVYLLPKLFPKNNLTNKLICVAGAGGSKDFSLLITDSIPNLDSIEKAQCFPLYFYEESQKHNISLFDEGLEGDYVRRDGVSDFILDRARRMYGKSVTKEDIFYYVYGFLHSSEYRTKFTNDLKKMLPRLPLVEEPRDFWKFSKAGRELAELHINYENVPPYEGVSVSGVERGNFKVEKMRFPKKDQKDTIFYNENITITGIPKEAYEYVVNGKSAVEWIMERYQVVVDRESGIKNDPNDWATEVGKPRYILDLLLSVINVSVKTVEIVKSLPKLSF